jgi:hypothetical protein
MPVPRLPVWRPRPTGASGCPGCRISSRFRASCKQTVGRHLSGGPSWRLAWGPPNRVRPQDVEPNANASRDRPRARSYPPARIAASSVARAGARYERTRGRLVRPLETFDRKPPPGLESGRMRLKEVSMRPPWCSCGSWRRLRAPRSHYARWSDRVTHKKRSPSNPVRLTERGRTRVGPNQAVVVGPSETVEPRENEYRKVRAAIGR